MVLGAATAMVQVQVASCLAANATDALAWVMPEEQPCEAQSTV